ncbi:cytotoxic T-lymphocyte protein 4 [Dendrobates tinctorius]|uniref:cytotoxic T-lymphocyte protein 4 n=1 Tax=Dendrobates tinctorius TaxID=92724 RepID=UPI003CC9B703
MLHQVFIAIFCIYSGMSEGTKVTQPAVIVANRHGEATLICDYSVYGMVEEIRFSLLKKTNKHISEICVFSFNTKYEHVIIGNTIRCLGVPSPHNVTFNISGLTAEDTGLYTCRMEVMYPPPYRSSEGNATLVYVSDLTYQCAQSIEPVEDNMYKWTLLIVFVVLLLYSLIVTGILLCKKRKRRWDIGYYEQILQSHDKNYHPYYVQF